MATQRLITHPEAREALDRIMRASSRSVPLPSRASGMIEKVFGAKPSKPLTAEDVRAAFDKAISTTSNDCKTAMEALRDRLIAVVRASEKRESKEGMAQIQI